MRYLLLLLGLVSYSGPLLGQQRPETHHYAIDIAGARIGTMTASKQLLPGNEVIYTQISDVQVNLLLYKVKIYYKVISRVKNGQLMLATVEAHTNRGNYSSRTEWTGTHYEIRANQYKYEHQSSESQRIDFTISMMYFSEPTGRQRIYAEYFGDYFMMKTSPRPSYEAKLGDREDEYIYEGGRLVRVIKKNTLKNFNIRLLD